MSKLFTPGPLNTTDTVKTAMLHDLGSRDKKFVKTVKSICSDLVDIVHGNKVDHCAIPLQGSGSYSVEAVFANVIGRSRGKALILANGAYAYRMIAMCEQADYNHTALMMPEDKPLDLSTITKELSEHREQYTLVCAVHCETSTGMFNPINEIAALVSTLSDAYYFVDAMSSLGAVPLDMSANDIHFVVSSANKCLQGVPGFAYVLAERTALAECKGNCASWAFDLCAQLQGLEGNGQFRCTPPTHTILAFRQALDEFHEETFEGRVARYRANNQIIRTGMKALGFELFDEHVAEEKRGYIISAFHYPSSPQFQFAQLYTKLSERGLVIYPGKVSKADTFRLGNIGDLHAADCQLLIQEIELVLNEMGVQLPVTYDK